MEHRDLLALGGVSTSVAFMGGVLLNGGLTGAIIGGLIGFFIGVVCYRIGRSRDAMYGKLSATDY